MTPQVDFYILGNADHVAKLKYACRITQKAYLQGLKVYLQTTDDEQSTQLDSLLWTFAQNSFIPHTNSSHGIQSWEDFPVQLGGSQSVPDEQSEQPEQADVLICLTESAPENYDRFVRIADLVIDEPEEKLSGRERFRFYKERGIEPLTHQIS